MEKSTKLTLAAIIAAIAFALPYAEKAIGVGGASINDTLQIEEPAENLLEDSKGILAIVTDPKDRAVLAMFNKEFSERILAYDGTVQNYNDVYVDAISSVFDDRLLAYNGLSNFTQASFAKVVGTKNGFVTAPERAALSKVYEAQAWVLGQ